MKKLSTMIPVPSSPVRRFLAVGFAVFICVFSLPVPAGGNWASQYSNLGPCNGTANANCTADSTAENWDYDLGPNMLTATFDTLYGSYDTTHLVVTLNNAGNNSFHNGYVDIYYHNAQVPDNAYAITDCITPLVGDSTKCDHTHVHYDPEALLPYANNANFLKSVACHETGQQVGLMHQPLNGGESMSGSDYACMRSDSVFPTNVGAHNVAHIDNHF